MQRWCPEPLGVETAAAGVFEALAPAVAASVADEDGGFRPETGFRDPTRLLRQLSREERAEVVELLEQDLRREYEDRLQRELAERDEAAARRQAEETELHDRWQRELGEGLRREVLDALGSLARETAAMAVVMATKLVRREVAQDPEVLVRTLETVLYKSAAGCPLAVTVHPDDAAWLAAAPAVRERLRIREVKEDRRLERGGCLVNTDELEWDATVERQLAVLGEAMDEALAMPPEPGEAGAEATPPEATPPEAGDA